MSWQTYVDDHLMCELPGGGRLSAAAIVGLDGGVWAQSDNFPALSAAEADAIVKGFDDQGTLAQNGLKVGGIKYMVIAGEEGAVIRGRKTPAGGCVFKKTNTAMLAGIYIEGVQPGDVNMVVENLGDYLIGQNI
ncbi:hypothetical protein WJX73_002351 [Symbiochloris irregularis]|uniref:Profilin n=1 Tax=Symbiochloris irregularis TaxID=706552 RepID=A0AAW1NT63_9CHLO